MGLDRDGARPQIKGLADAGGDGAAAAAEEEGGNGRARRTSRVITASWSAAPAPSAPDLSPPPPQDARIEPVSPRAGEEPPAPPRPLPRPMPTRWSAPEIWEEDDGGDRGGGPRRQSHQVGGLGG